ncbi:MAG TPA: MBL fold metallo-hydrolase [Gemmatimonadaceae bacterium]|nr:MBL fold metallo-hydrolase [Gemmatimonadaceae bacterium]
MEIEFFGAAREVTGSCHILRVNGKTVLLDCGMFQGRREESREKNLRLPLRVAEADALVLSHAHIDHSGRLPFLVREGFDKTIHATPATRDLCAIMLQDSAEIQERDAEFLARRTRDRKGRGQRRDEPPPPEPLYGVRHAARTMELMVGVPYGKPFDVVPGVRGHFVDAGHILGSASVVLDVAEGGATRRLVFSGDVGRSGLAIIRDPQPPEGADAVIMESTYGNRDHESVEGAREHLGRVVRETAARGGRVLIPAFAVGRTQEIVYELHQLSRAGQIPSIPIYIDSPLATDATSVFQMHPDVFDQSEDLVGRVGDLFRFELVRFTRDVGESKALNSAQGPMVIIAASGMAESGRILHHLAHGAGDPRNTILVVGFMAEHTLGRRIVERAPTLKVFDDEIPLRATVEIINGYSAHADRTELTAWLDAVRARGTSAFRDRGGPVFLVHGEPEAQDALRDALGEKGYRVGCPTPGERVEV